MITAEEWFKREYGTKDITEITLNGIVIIRDMKEFVKEAIKADRINLLKHVKCYINPNGANISSSLTIDIDKDSIINAPNVEIK